MRKYIVGNSRLKGFLACLLVLSIITGTWLITQISATPVYADETDSTSSYASANGVETKKTVADNGDGSYTITLESYTTGKVTQETTSAPIDFVLVLDQSGSMKSNNLGDVTRQQAMINAINGTDSKPGFVDIVSEKSSEQADNRVAIVTFATNAKTVLPWTFVKGNETTIKNKVSSLNADGLTDTASGMSNASTLLNNLDYSGKNETRQKVVIFLSDGIARTGKVGQYSPQFAPANANSAIATAKTLKDAGVTIYTIGIFEDADPGLTYPAHLSADSTKWNGKSGTTPANSIETIEAGIGNRFCNYLSSNYLYANTLGLTYSESNSTSTQVYVTVDTKTNYTRDSDQYFLTADNSDALANIFQTITKQVTTPEINLGSETVVKDVITPYFEIKDGSSVKVYTANATDSTITNDEWNERVEENSLVPDTVGNTIKVTGFDYNANCVSETLKPDGSYGKKLIVEFTVSPIENFLGGTVPTNITEQSELIVTDDEGNETIIQNFIPSPNVVSVPLKEIKPEDAEWNIYLTTEDKLGDKFKELTFTINNKEVDFETLFNKTNNAGVNVTFEVNDSDGNNVYSYTVSAGKTLDDWIQNMPALSDGDYTIKCIVADAGEKLTSKTNTADVKINVFKPTLTFTDMTVYYGEKVDLSGVEPVVQWKCGDNLDSSVEMHTSKPTLTYEYDGVTNGMTVDQTDDYTVSVKKIYVKETNAEGAEINREVTIDNSITFLRNCVTEKLNGETGSANEAFKIHVKKKVALTIQKNVAGNFGDKSRKFIFYVTITLPDGSNPSTQTIGLKDGETKKLENLPQGTQFTIVEKDVPKGYTVTATVNGTSVEVSEKGIEQKYDYTITGTLSDVDAKVEVTNTLEMAAPTGIDDGNTLFAYGIILLAGIGLIFLLIVRWVKIKKIHLQ